MAHSNYTSHPRTLVSQRSTAIKLCLEASSDFSDPGVLEKSLQLLHCERVI